jgi:predicted Zn finger-like uncharacterized protein
MKVTCQSCQAKYTIADEKVRGKVAKIRCKKCGTTIIVNGTDAAASGSTVADYTQQGPADEQWSILVADGDQRTLTVAQVAELFTGGSISYETPAWKDGMPDWLPISQIDALRTVLEHGPQPSMLPDHGQLASMLPDVQPAAAAAAPMLPTVPEPVAARASAPVAARINAPAAGRRPRGGSTDLFGAAAQDDVMTSAAADPVPHVPAPGHDKPTGARNENSVLFSLAALTGGGGNLGGAKPASASADKGPPPSSKADLRSLMAGADNKPAQKSKLDDIINLSGGGVYSPAMLTAPILAPPPVELPVAGDVVGAPAKPKSKMTLILVGVVGLIAIGAVVFTMNSKAESEAAMAAASASAKAASEALQAALAAAQEAKNAPEPAPAETTSAAPTALAPGQVAPKPEGEKKTVVARADKADKAAPAPAPPPGPQLEKIPPATPAPKEQAPAPAPAGGGGDFDRAAALSALSAAATAAQSCKKSDGPTGSGRIAVTFANNGQATTANVEGPPFAGTPVGGCVAARFRGTHVPPFGGAPVTVHKTFNIN